MCRLMRALTFSCPGMMKHLYIDESLDEKHFVVGGILVSNEQDLLLAYRQLKKQVSSIPMTRKQKERVTYEFKATLLDRTFPQIKRKLLNKLNDFDCEVVYATCQLNGRTDQKEKEKNYIALLKKIVNGIDDSVVITFDSFGNSRFERDIIREISKYNNVISINYDLSYNNKGIQFADNVCGVLRKHLSGTEKDGFYEIIRKKIRRSD